jgi:hypothetical protein
MKYMRIEEYMRTRFAPGSCPALKTLRRWINEGKLPGVKKGHFYFVDIDAEKHTTGNPLVDHVLRDS